MVNEESQDDDIEFLQTDERAIKILKNVILKFKIVYIKSNFHMELFFLY